MRVAGFGSVKIHHARRSYFWFAFIYGVITATIVMASTAFVAFSATYQSGVLALMVVMAGVLLLASAAAEKLLDLPERRRICIILCVFAAAQLIFTTIYLYNLIHILVKECPNHHHIANITTAAPTAKRRSEVAGEGMPEPMFTPGIAITIDYRWRHAASGEIREDVILLRYNETARHIAQRRKMNYGWYGAIPEETFYASARGDSYTLLELHRRANHSFYSLMEAEVNTILMARLDEVDSKNVFRTTQIDDLRGTGEEARMTLLDHQIRYLCQQEYGFTIFWVIFLFFTQILNIITIGLFAWLATD